MTSQAPPPPPGPPPGKSVSQIEREEAEDIKSLKKAFDAVRSLNTSDFKLFLQDKRVTECLERPANEEIVAYVNGHITAGTNMPNKEGIRQKYTLEEGQTLSDYLQKRGKADGLYDNPNYDTHIALRRAYDNTHTRLIKDGQEIKTFQTQKEMPNPMGDLFAKPNAAGVVDAAVLDDDASRYTSDNEASRTPSPAIVPKGASPEVLDKALKVAGNVKADLQDDNPGTKTPAPGGKKSRFNITPVEE